WVSPRPSPVTTTRRGTRIQNGSCGPSRKSCSGSASGPVRWSWNNRSPHGLSGTTPVTGIRHSAIRHRVRSNNNIAPATALSSWPLDKWGALQAINQVNRILADKATKRYGVPNCVLLIRHGVPIFSGDDFRRFADEFVIPARHEFRGIYLLAFREENGLLHVGQDLIRLFSVEG